MKHRSGEHLKVNKCAKMPRKSASKALAQTPKGIRTPGPEWLYKKAPKPKARILGFDGKK